MTKAVFALDLEDDFEILEELDYTEYVHEINSQIQLSISIGNGACEPIDDVAYFNMKERDYA